VGNLAADGGGCLSLRGGCGKARCGWGWWRWWGSPSSSTRRTTRSARSRQLSRAAERLDCGCALGTSAEVLRRGAARLTAVLAICCSPPGWQPCLPFAARFPVGSRASLLQLASRLAAVLAICCSLPGWHLCLPFAARFPVAVKVGATQTNKKREVELLAVVWRFQKCRPSFSGAQRGVGGIVRGAHCLRPTLGDAELEFLNEATISLPPHPVLRYAHIPHSECITAAQLSAARPILKAILKRLPEASVKDVKRHLGKGCFACEEEGHFSRQCPLFFQHPLEDCEKPAAPKGHVYNHELFCLEHGIQPAGPAVVSPLSGHLIPAWMLSSVSHSEKSPTIKKSGKTPSPTIKKSIQKTVSTSNSKRNYKVDKVFGVDRCTAVGGECAMVGADNLCLTCGRVPIKPSGGGKPAAATRKFKGKNRCPGGCVERNEDNQCLVCIRKPLH
jgi:hypothetical protein